MGAFSDPQHPHKGHAPVGVAIHGPGWLGYSFREKGRSQDSNEDHVAPKQPQCRALPVSLMPQLIHRLWVSVEVNSTQVGFILALAPEYAPKEAGMHTFY